MESLDTSTRILVVDDGDAIRVLMRKYLERLGYKDVRLADSVDMGLKAFQEHGSEVVFLDVSIADKKGSDFAIPALADRPDTTIIVLTAFPATHPDVTALVAHGARDYLPKPVQLQRLRETLDRIADEWDDELEEIQSVSDASYL